MQRKPILIISTPNLTGNMQTKAFFGENGLTSTSANYISNIAKEFYTNVERALSTIQLYSEKVSIIGSSDSTTISNGWTSESFNEIKDMLKQISDAKSLIAFLREAIKERDRLYKEAKSYQDTVARANCQRPEEPTYLTEEDIIKSWSIGEQEKYLSLETECAVLGKFIHESGALNKARKELTEKRIHPCTISNGVKDTLVYKYAPTIAQSEVDSLFFELQSEHREKQAELNGLKHKIETAIKEDTLKKDSEYSESVSKYSSKLDKILASETLKRQELTREVEALKIVIPNNLKSVYEAIKKLS